jgi:hypothetical protein
MNVENLHEPMTEAEVTGLVEDGIVVWPRTILEIDVEEETWIELMSRRRTFHPIYFDDEDQAEQLAVGDLLVFWPAGRRRVFPDPELRQITDLWTHAGIAPGWVIASLRPVKLVEAR